MYEEIFSGLHEDPKKHLEIFLPDNGSWWDAVGVDENNTLILVEAIIHYMVNRINFNMEI